MDRLNGETSGIETLEGNISGSGQLRGDIANNIEVGLTPDINIGTVETVDSLELAEVELATTSTKLKPIFNFKIPRGVQGERGNDGYTPVKGIDYRDGIDGVDGRTPIKGVDYFDGTNGKDGVNGIDGKTPVKGVDYWTEADKQDIINTILTNVPYAEEAEF